MISLPSFDSEKTVVIGVCLILVGDTLLFMLLGLVVEPFDQAILYTLLSSCCLIVFLFVYSFGY